MYYNVSQKMQNITLFIFFSDDPKHLVMSTYLNSFAGPELFAPFSIFRYKAAMAEHQIVRS